MKIKTIFRVAVKSKELDGTLHKFTLHLEFNSKRKAVRWAKEQIKEGLRTAKSWESFAVEEYYKPYKPEYSFWQRLWAATANTNPKYFFSK